MEQRREPTAEELESVYDVDHIITALNFYLHDLRSTEVVEGIHADYMEWANEILAANLDKTFVELDPREDKIIVDQVGRSINQLNFVGFDTLTYEQNRRVDVVFEDKIDHSKHSLPIKRLPDSFKLHIIRHDKRLLEKFLPTTDSLS